MQPDTMPLVEREDARVPVALAEQRGEPHRLDERLVRAKAGQPGGEVLGGAVEPLPRDGVERVRMAPFQLGDERSQVGRHTGRR
jgi:hypothetical protein